MVQAYNFRGQWLPRQRLVCVPELCATLGSQFKQQRPSSQTGLKPRVLWQLKRRVYSNMTSLAGFSSEVEGDYNRNIRFQLYYNVMQGSIRMAFEIMIRIGQFGLPSN